MPEFLELSALLWDSEVEFTLVDHNEDVIKAMQENKIYYFPTMKQLGIGAAAEERMSSLDSLRSIGKVVDESKPNELHLPLPNEKHVLKFVQSDFTAFEYLSQARGAVSVYML